MTTFGKKNFGKMTNPLNPFQKSVDRRGILKNILFILFILLSDL
jgi:hypothetical protein